LRQQRLRAVSDGVHTIRRFELQLSNVRYSLRHRGVGARGGSGLLGQQWLRVASPVASSALLV
jgi:hypothetical protein